MKEPHIIPIQPTYKRENGLWVLDIDSIVLPDNIVIREKAIVSIPPKKYGGNHKHPRIEAFIGLGDSLECVWTDNSGKIHRHTFMKEGMLTLLVMPAYVPHAVINKSNSTTQILLEYANEPQHDVKTVQVVS